MYFFWTFYAFSLYYFITKYIVCTEELDNRWQEGSVILPSPKDAFCQVGMKIASGSGEYLKILSMIFFLFLYHLFSEKKKYLIYITQ